MEKEQVKREKIKGKREMPRVALHLFQLRPFESSQLTPDTVEHRQAVPTVSCLNFDHSSYDMLVINCCFKTLTFGIVCYAKSVIETSPFTHA